MSAVPFLPPSLPFFERTPESPELASGSPGIALGLTGRRREDLVAHGTWGLDVADRADLAPGPLRPRAWIVAVDRRSCFAWKGQPGRDAVVLGEDEPGDGPAEGWFHCRLAEVLGLPGDYDGTLDVMAVIGTCVSPVVSVEVPAPGTGLR